MSVRLFRWTKQRDYYRNVERYLRVNMPIEQEMVYRFLPLNERWNVNIK